MSVHVIHFATGLNAASAEGLRNACLKALSQGATDLRIHFSCEGGPTIHALMLHNFLRSLPVPVRMHNIGRVESMGLIVFLGARERLCNPHSAFLIHPLHWDFGQGRVDFNRLTEYSDRLEEEAERYARVFDEVTEGSPAPLQIRTHLTTVHRIINGADAVECGIVHKVTEAALPADSFKWWVSAQGAIESSQPDT